MTLARKSTLKRSPMPRGPRPTGVLGQASFQKLAKKVKPRRCDHCRQPFEPSLPGAKVCSPDCAEGLMESNKAKAARVAAKAVRAGDKVRKEALKRRADWLKEAQTAFNAFVRERDKDQPCICCGRTATAVQGLGSHGWDCGHYRSVGSAPHMRFIENNAHRQLVLCNRYGAGRAVDYRIGLISRIGLQAVEAIEADNEPRKYSIEELKEIKALYKAKLKASGPRPASSIVIEEFPLDDEFDRMAEAIDDL